MLKAGQKIPALKAIGPDGKSVRLSSFRGNWLALVFYPRDMTPTCTVQVCNLRDEYGKLSHLGITVLGINEDPSESHRKFREKHGLPFPLLTDADHSLMDTFGVWGPKKLYGKSYMGIHRTTVLIDPEGKFRAAIQKVDAKNHAEQIVRAWEESQK